MVRGKQDSNAGIKRKGGGRGAWGMGEREENG